MQTPGQEAAFVGKGNVQNGLSWFDPKKTAEKKSTCDDKMLPDDMQFSILTNLKKRLQDE